MPLFCLKSLGEARALEINPTRTKKRSHSDKTSTVQQMFSWQTWGPQKTVHIPGRYWSYLMLRAFVRKHMYTVRGKLWIRF